MFDPILAALEVYPLPAEALEGVQTRTGCSQEDRHKTSPTATEERLTWVLTPAQTGFIIHWRHLLISSYRRVRQQLSRNITIFRKVTSLCKTCCFSISLPSFPAFLICPDHAECLIRAALLEILTSHLCLSCQLVTMKTEFLKPRMEPLLGPKNSNPPKKTHWLAWAVALAPAKVSHQHNREAGGHWPPRSLLSMSWDVIGTQSLQT